MAWPKEVKSIAAIYRCPGCHAEYDNVVQALKCANSTPAPIFEVGQFVDPGLQYHWYDGKTEWVRSKIGPQGRGLHKEPLSFWAVITAIDLPGPRDHDAHRPRYHVATRALYNSDKAKEHGFRIWYTNGDHLKVITDRVPGDLRKQAKKLIGKKGEYVQ